MSLTRRTFIQGGMATGVSVAFLSSQAEGALVGHRDRSIVIVQLFGGNDTLNTFIPYSDTKYRTARPTLAVPERLLLPLDSSFALHPAMAPLLPCYQQRKFAFIPDLGFPSLDRSHFYCVDVWHGASETIGSGRDGWLGRFADTYLAGSSPLQSLAIGTRIPPALRAQRVTATTIVDLKSFDVATMQTDASERARFIGAARNLLATSRETTDAEFIRNSSQTLFQTVDLLKTVPPPSVTVDYPKNSDGSRTGLAEALRIVAQTIAANLGTTIAWVTVDGFDTHSQQVDSGSSPGGAHARLLANVSASLAAFQQELEQRQIAERVLVLGWSEFGRRLAENASLGTDHGKAGTAFVLGNAVKGGTYYGKPPDLRDLDNGDLRTRTDFRSVYATIIRDWFGCDPHPILAGDYENLGFIERGIGRTRAVRS